MFNAMYGLQKYKTFQGAGREIKNSLYVNMKTLNN